MRLSFSPPGLQRGKTEALRRRVYLLVAALACLSQTVLAVLDGLSGAGIRWESVFGAVLCAALVPFLWKRSVPVRWVDFGVLAAASLGVAVQLADAFQRPEVPLPRLYFAGVFLFLAAFSILPARFAALYSAVLYSVLTALTLHKRGDTTLLIELAVVVMLTLHLSVFGQRVTAERTEAQVFEKLAQTDSLTGLENRRAMYERLDHAFERAEHGEPSSVLLLDIDHFKAINDAHGHPVGDQVLQALAMILHPLSAQQHGVSRWGGEEFLVLLRGTGVQEAVTVAQRLLSDIRTTPLPSAIQVTASCGVAAACEATSVADWLLRVDERLYTAKTSGRDQVHPLVLAH